MRSIPGKSGRIDDEGVRSLWKKAADEGLVVNVLIQRENAEKPLALSLADLEAVERDVKRHCVPLTMLLPMRFYPVFQEMKPADWRRGNWRGRVDAGREVLST